MRLRVLAVTLLLAALGPASSARADYVPGTVGHDVSYPQCTSAGATTTGVGSLGGSFGVVGVTGGRPFGPNSCAAAQYSWAAALPGAPALYMNTANPAPRSSYYWPTSGASDPALCLDATSTKDPGCAYDYGWHAAADALTTQAAGIPGAASLVWWLDVETGNSWYGDGVSNAAVLQGATDYLRSHGVPAVGLYSTGYQWSTITGGYSTSTAASYESAWSRELTPQYPMTASPVWVAGFGSASSAQAACGTSFTGGPTWLAQYDDGSGYDADLACGTSTSPPAASSFALSLSPASGSAKRGGKASSTVSVTESGPVQTLRLSASAPSGVTATLSPTSLGSSGTSALKVAVGRSVAPGTYSVTVTGTGSSGTSTATYSLTVR